MRIAFFDSGIGGLNVLHAAAKVLPGAECVYLADTLNAPYGTKSHDAAKSAVLETVEGLVNGYSPDMLVIACNTATSIAVESLRAKYAFPVVGMEPAVKPAVQLCKDGAKRVLVLTTELTMREEKFRNLVERVDSDHKVDCMAMQELVRYADDLDFAGPGPETYIREKMAQLDMARYGTVVFGCTHFIYFRDLMSRLLPCCIDFIDGTDGTVRRVCTLAGPSGEAGVCADGSEKRRMTFVSTDPAKMSSERLADIYHTIFAEEVK